MKDNAKRKLLLPANAKAIKAAEAIGGKETEYRVKGVPGLVLRVRPPTPEALKADPTAKGAASFYCYYHTGKGERRKLNKVRLGSRDVTALVDACERAKEMMRNVEAGRDPAAERASTVDALLDDHLKRHVRPNLRSADEIDRVFRVYVRPEIGAKSIYELKRSDIVEMLDGIEDEHGPVMADRTLAHLRKAFNWHAARDDNFNSPIVKGMARTSPAERKRRRVLDDQEIRDLWKALDTADDLPSCYPGYVRALLLTAQRRSEVAEMRWEAVDGDVWTIPADGHKTGDRAGDMMVPLTAAALALMGKPRKRGFVFSTTAGSEAFSGFSKAKRALDKRIAELRETEGREPMPHWVLHDLRRTARSLMSRAGVASDIAERVLGHVIPGVRGVYDRHAYAAEKSDALERLAKLVGGIIAGKVQEQQPADAEVDAPGQEPFATSRGAARQSGYQPMPSPRLHASRHDGQRSA
jgi:integrase